MTTKNENPEDSKVAGIVQKETKVALVKELGIWIGFFEQLLKACEDSPDDVYTDALHKARQLVIACDKEVVYLQKLEEVLKGRIDAEAKTDAEVKPGQN